MRCQNLDKVLHAFQVYLLMKNGMKKKINKLESGDGTLIICKFSERERERDKRNMLPKAKADSITKYLLHFCCKFEQL